jgi:hypothetical protein
MASALPDLVGDVDESLQQQRPAEPRQEPPPLPKPAAAEEAQADRPRIGAEVVQLDRFRKK